VEGTLDDGAASGGSQLQTQIYVNRHADELDAKIRRAFAELAQATLSWRSPLSSQRYREYWDRAFLEAVDQRAQWPARKRFWPAGGPYWDALAVVSRPGTALGVLPVEAKSHVDELLKRAAIGRDVAFDSRIEIERAMAWTQGSLEICDRKRGRLVRHAALPVGQPPRASPVA
jgi:hypothetical protein